MHKDPDLARVAGVGGRLVVKHVKAEGDVEGHKLVRNTAWARTHAGLGSAALGQQRVEVALFAAAGVAVVGEAHGIIVGDTDDAVIIVVLETKVLELALRFGLVEGGSQAGSHRVHRDQPATIEVRLELRAHRERDLNVGRVP
eukprot:3932649-Rhodomonas_salina.1